MKERTSRLVITVQGPPVKKIRFEFYGGRKYEVDHVRLDLPFASGNFHSPRWKCSGVAVKKDGTLGTARGAAQYGTVPDAETQKQFIDTAMRLIKDVAANGDPR